MNFSCRRWTIAAWVTHRLTLLSYLLLFENGLLCCHPVLIVVKVFTTEKETEFGIVPLLVLGHLFKLGSIPRHELGQFVDYIL